MWVFYYLYSADHKFLKAILKQKFPFCSLFAKEIQRLRKPKFKEIIKQVYSESTAKQMDNKPPITQKHFAYTVPVKQSGKGYAVDWTFVDRAINYIKVRLLELYLPTERHIVCAKYNLDEYAKADKNKMVVHVWENKFIGNRHVIISSEESKKSWHKPIDLGSGKQNEKQSFVQKLRSDLEVLNSKRNFERNAERSDQFIEMLKSQEQGFGEELIFTITAPHSQHSQLSFQKPEKKQFSLTMMEYYFIKQGQLLSTKFSPHIVKCRKERHFVDFGKKRKEDFMDLQYNQSVAPQSKKVNTIFDVPEQSLSLAPLSYEQYQVLQQSCYHFLNLNEFMLIQKFIN